ncbi:MAG: helix-turn-helix domain-containing protein [Pseudomonadota bacterium]
MNLAEIGVKIHDSRLCTGLSQEQLAKFAGLSRVTINQLEKGTVKDLSYTKLKSVLDVLSINVETVQPFHITSALTVAARSASTSYRDVLTSDMLAMMLRSGQAPEQFHPHLMALLDETPLPLVVRAVSEAATPGVPARKIMKHLSAWATHWKVCRTVW